MKKNLLYVRPIVFGRLVLLDTLDPYIITPILVFMFRASALSLKTQKLIRILIYAADPYGPRPVSGP